MAMVANDPKAAKRVDIPQSVGTDYMKADKGRKFASTKAKINKQDTRHGKLDMPNASLNKFAGMAKGGDVAESKKMVKKEVNFFKKKGAPKSMIKHEEAELSSMKKGGKVKKYAKGGGIESKGKTKGKFI